MPKTANPIKQIIDQIITHSGLTGMPKDEEAFFREKMEEYINRRIGFLLLNNLSPAGLKEYEALIASEKSVSQMKLQRFFVENIPDMEKKLAEGMRDFLKDVMLATSPARA